jgi:hypothetical protein
MTESANYALRLFALVDRAKLDAGGLPRDELAENLGGFLQHQFGLEALDVRIEQLAGEPYLILNGVARAGLPKLLALADVQKTQLFAYRRDSAELATLTPLAVKPGDD